MKKIKLAFLALAFACAALTFTATGMGEAQAQERAASETSATQRAVTTEKTRSISPEKAHMVILKLKAADGAQGTTCCTHWNTSTGGTGCASFPDECPSGQFKVDCGPKGCW